MVKREEELCAEEERGATEDAEFTELSVGEFRARLPCAPCARGACLIHRGGGGRAELGGFRKPPVAHTSECPFCCSCQFQPMR